MRARALPRRRALRPRRRHQHGGAPPPQTALQFGVGKQALHLPLPAQFKVFAAILVALFAGYAPAPPPPPAAAARPPPTTPRRRAPPRRGGGAYVAYRNDDSS